MRAISNLINLGYLLMLSTTPKTSEEEQSKPPFFRLEFDKETQARLYQAAADAGVPVEVFADGIHCTIAYKNYRNDPDAIMQDGYYAKDFLMPHVGKPLNLKVNSIVIKEDVSTREHVAYFQVEFPDEYFKHSETGEVLKKPTKPHISIGRIARRGHYGEVMEVVQNEEMFSDVLDELKSNMQQGEVAVSGKRVTSGAHQVMSLDMTIQGTLQVSESYGMSLKKSAVTARAAYLRDKDDSSFFPYVETAVVGESKLISVVKLRTPFETKYAVVNNDEQALLTWIDDLSDLNIENHGAGKPFQLSVINMPVNKYVTNTYAFVCTKGDAALVCISDPRQYEKDVAQYKKTSLAYQIIECGMKHKVIKVVDDMLTTGEYHDGMNISPLGDDEQPSITLHNEKFAGESLKDSDSSNAEKVILHEARKIIERHSVELFLLSDAELKDRLRMELESFDLNEEHLNSLVEFTGYLKETGMDVTNVIAFRNDVSKQTAESEGNIGMGNIWNRFKNKEELKQGEIYAFRGVPGIGKDTLAEYLQAQNPALNVLSKDMFEAPDVYRLDEFDLDKVNKVLSTSTVLKPIFIWQENREAKAYIYNPSTSRYETHGFKVSGAKKLFGQQITTTGLSLSPSGCINFDRDHAQDNMNDYVDMFGDLLKSVGYKVIKQKKQNAYIDRRVSFIECLKLWVNQGKSVLVTCNYETTASLNKDFRDPVMVFKRGKKVPAPNPFADISLTCIEPLDLSNKENMNVLYALIFSVLGRDKHATLGHKVSDPLKIMILLNFFIRWENIEGSAKVQYFSSVPEQSPEACEVLAQALARCKEEKLHLIYNFSDIIEEKQAAFDEITQAILEQVSMYDHTHSGRRALQDIASTLREIPVLSCLFVGSDLKESTKASSNRYALFDSTAESMPEEHPQERHAHTHIPV